MPDEGNCPLIDFDAKLADYVNNDELGDINKTLKLFVPWYVKTEGCEMIKTEDSQNSESLRKTAVVETAQNDATVKEEAIIIKTEKIKSETTSLVISNVHKKRKIVQHLDMQG